MNINVNQPMTMGQLAQLYTGSGQDPQSVDSNLFLNSSQSQDYVHQQAQNLGIGSDPASFFTQRNLAQQMAQTPNGGTMEAMRLAGQYAPGSLPAQLAAHQQQIGQVQQQDIAQAASLASLQQQALNKQYQLPVNGAPPTLSPLMKQDMAARGITDPTAYLLQQRLGGNRSMVAPFSKVAPSEYTTEGGVDPEHLYNAPTFQVAMQAHPDKASAVFSALTGGDLGQFHAGQQALNVAQTKQGTSDLHEALSSGRAKVNDDGSISWRKLIPNPDPTKPGLILSNDYGPGDAYQKSIEKHLGGVSKNLQEFKDLAAKGGVSQVASVQQDAIPTSVPARMDASPIFGTGVMGTANSALQGMGADISRVLSGQAQAFSDTSVGAHDYDSPAGRAAIHAAPALRNNPRFQALLKSDPAKARQIIMAIQQGGFGQ